MAGSRYFTTRLMVGAFVTLAFSNPGVTEQLPRLVTEHFMIDAADSGIKLYVRNKRPEGMKQFASEKTLLFVHGATQPAEATFDLSLEGLSWMDTSPDTAGTCTWWTSGATGLRPARRDESASCKQSARVDDRCSGHGRRLGNRLHPPTARCGETQPHGLVLGNSDHGCLCGQTPRQGRSAGALRSSMGANSIDAASGEPPLGSLRGDGNEAARERLQAGAPENRKNESNASELV